MHNDSLRHFIEVNTSLCVFLLGLQSLISWALVGALESRVKDLLQRVEKLEGGEVRRG